MSDWMRVTRRSALLGCGAGLLSPWAAEAAAAKPESARTAIARACALAGAERKGVLVVFYASWCVWCRVMDALLEQRACASAIGSRFRTLHMRVLEREPRFMRQQLIGADDLYSAHAGPDDGVPFLLFLDAAGRTLATTRAPSTNENIGVPSTAADLAYFDEMLVRAAPDMNAGERSAVIAACRRLGAGR